MGGGMRLLLLIPAALVSSFLSLGLPFEALPAGTLDEKFRSVFIRVALSSPNTQVEIEGAPHLLVSTDTGRLFPGRSIKQLTVGSGPRGLILNGKETSFQKIDLSSPGNRVQVDAVAVKGRISIFNNREGITVVNTLPIEAYLMGVVPLEISAKWHPEVLKVQAIISRTYALFQMEVNQDREFDLVSTTLDQVYKGVAMEHPAANKAIFETRGEVLSFEGNILQAFFHSTSAGPTEDAGKVWGINLPYLQGVSCPFDDASPYFDWTVSIPLKWVRTSLEREGYSVGTIAAVSPLRWTRSGRVDQIRILHSKGEQILSGPEFRKILGYTRLPSTQFIIKKIGSSLRLQGLGAGHAVGLCQWGAKEMAERGHSHKTILQHYYPGSTLVHQSSLGQKLFWP